MNRLCCSNGYSAQKLRRTVDQTGMRVYIHPHVHPFIRREVRTFCHWVRATYPLPVRVCIHIPNALKILARDGTLCYGLCFIPDDPDDHIDIYVAGGYRDTGRLKDLQDYTWTTIGTLAHELSHDYQYIHQLELTDPTSERQAGYYRRKILDEYYAAEWDSMDDWPDAEDR